MLLSSCKHQARCGSGLRQPLEDAQGKTVTAIDTKVFAVIVLTVHPAVVQGGVDERTIQKYEK